MRIIGGDEVEVVCNAGAQIGEGPIWDASTSSLLWVDIPRHRLHRWRRADAQLLSYNVGQPVGAVAKRLTGGLMLAVRDGFAVSDHDPAHVELVCPVEID